MWHTAQTVRQDPITNPKPQQQQKDHANDPISYVTVFSPWAINQLFRNMMMTWRGN